MTNLNYIHQSLSSRAVRSAFGLTLSLGLAACGDDSGTDDGNNGSSTGSAATDSTGSANEDTTSTPADSSGDDNGTTAADTTAADTTAADSGSGEDSSSGGAGLEIDIAGVYEETIGKDVTTHTITNESWEQDASFGMLLFHFEMVDNDAQWAVAQNDSNNGFDPDLYSKFNWLTQESDLYYCQAVFNAETAEDAANAADGDPGDLAEGCNGFPWSLLVPVE